MFRHLCLYVLLAALAGCADPLRGVDRISDVNLTEDQPTAQVLPLDQEGASAAVTDIAGNATGDAPPVKQPRGLLGLLSRVMPVPDVEPAATEKLAILDADAVETTAPQTEPAPVVLASLVPEPTQKPKRKGFLSRILPEKTPPRSGPDAMDVPYGTKLPYGVIARVCEARLKPMGRKIERASARGYALFDSDPDSGAPRTYYITGFADGCPRQLTAANVLLGAPSFYEQLRYGPVGADLPKGATDAAYEKIKSQVCGVRQGKPCGSKIKALEKTTFFVNSYEWYGENTRWSELLIHDGAVIASALKTSG